MIKKFIEIISLLSVIMFLFFLLGCEQPASQQQETTKQIAVDSSIYKRLNALGYDTLSHRVPPNANFISAVQTGQLIYLSGHGPLANERSPITGKVGLDISIEEANEAAKLTALLLLHSLEDEIGDLNKVKKNNSRIRHGQCHSRFQTTPCCN